MSGGIIIDADWTVWNCRACRQELGATWVDAEAGLWQQRVDGADAVVTRRARRLAVNAALRWVLIDPLNDTEMRAGTWQDTIPLPVMRTVVTSRALVVREISNPRAAWFDRLFGRRK